MHIIRNYIRNIRIGKHHTLFHNPKLPVHLKNIFLAHINIKAFHLEHSYLFTGKYNCMLAYPEGTLGGNGVDDFPHNRPGFSCSEMALMT